MITLRILTRQIRMIQEEHRVLEVEVFRVIVPGEALVLVAAARPTLTRPMAVGGDQIQEEGEDARQEEGEDQDLQVHQMAQEEAAAQEVAAATDQWGVEEEVEADLTVAGADLTSISLTLMLLVAAAEEQAQAVQGTTLF